MGGWEKYVHWSIGRLVSRSISRIYSQAKIHKQVRHVGMRVCMDVYKRMRVCDGMYKHRQRARGREGEREKMATNEVKVRRKHSLITRRLVYLHSDVIVRICVCIRVCASMGASIPWEEYVQWSVGRSISRIYSQAKIHKQVRHVGMRVCMDVYKRMRWYVQTPPTTSKRKRG